MSATHLSHVEAARDAALQMATQTRREREGTGQTAVTARVTTAAIEAFVLAIAEERDRGTSNEEIGCAIIMALSNLTLTGSANAFGRPTTKAETLWMLEQVNSAALHALGNLNTVVRESAQPAGSA